MRTFRCVELKCKSLQDGHQVALQAGVKGAVDHMEAVAPATAEEV